MLQKSPVLTPSLKNLSYILRHREWWPDGFHWNYSRTSSCAIGMCQQLWSRGPEALHEGLRDSELTWEKSRDYHRIFCSLTSKVPWWKIFLWSEGRLMSKVTPEQVADQIDLYLTKHPA